MPSAVICLFVPTKTKDLITSSHLGHVKSHAGTFWAKPLHFLQLGASISPSCNFPMFFQMSSQHLLVHNKTRKTTRLLVFPRPVRAAPQCSLLSVLLILWNHKVLRMYTISKLFMALIAHARRDPKLPLCFVLSITDLAFAFRTCHLETSYILICWFCRERQPNVTWAVKQKEVCAFRSLKVKLLLFALFGCFSETICSKPSQTQAPGNLWSKKQWQFIL